MRQMVGEELNLRPQDIAAIELVEGDTALTPDQGPTAGSTGVMRGGVQLRQAAATAREALLGMAAQKLNRPAAELTLEAGAVTAGTQKLTIAELVGDRTFNTKLDPKAPLKNPQRYTVVGQSLPRPDIPAKLTGRFMYVHDFKLPDMLHAPRDPPGRGGREAAGGRRGVDQAHPRRAGGAHQQNFLAVVAPDEWAAVRAAKALKARWSEGPGLVGHAGREGLGAQGPVRQGRTHHEQGQRQRARRGGERAGHARRQGEFRLARAVARSAWARRPRWPTCAPTRPRCGRPRRARTAITRRCAAAAGLPADKLRVLYLDGAGCYGMNGHDDAAADAVLLSKAVGRPVRVQWTREDELGWDPKGPPQVSSCAARSTREGRIAAWEAEMWVPMRHGAGRRHQPARPDGRRRGAAARADDRADHAERRPAVHGAQRQGVRALAQRRAAAAVEHPRAGQGRQQFRGGMLHRRLAAEAKIDPLEFRLRDLPNPRGQEVLKRCGALIGWQPRTSPAPANRGNIARGRGISYVHYKHNETYVAIAMDVEVDKTSGAIKVLQIACAHDCGLMINPDAVRNQVEGNILQTLSRTLHELTTFDKQRVTSVDWTSYQLLRFSEVPAMKIDLIQRVDQPPLGAGEAASAPVPAALANAVFDATGAWLGEVPFTAERMKAAMRMAV